MSGVVATSAAALALYFYIKQKVTCGVNAETLVPAPIEAYRNVEHPPNTWIEAIDYVKEVFRYLARSWGVISIHAPLVILMLSTPIKPFMLVEPVCLTVMH